MCKLNGNVRKSADRLSNIGKSFCDSWFENILTIVANIDAFPAIWIMPVGPEVGEDQ